MSIKFFWNNLFDSATLTASSADADFPVSNLKNPLRKKVWKTSGETSGTASLVIDHGAATSVSSIILANYDWSSAPSTLDLEFNATDSWGAPSETEALTWAATPDAYGNKNVIVKTFASKSYRYNRLNVVYSPGAVPTDWELGRVFVGSYFEPTRDYLNTHSEVIIDDSIISTSVGGQKYVDEIEKYREKRMNFMVTTYAQWRSFQLLFNSIGIGKDIFVEFDSSYPNEMTMYGALLAFTANRVGEIFTLNFGFKESR